MKTYIISYDLSKPGQDYSGLIREIRNYGNWARLGGSAYLIITNQTPAQIRDKLKQHLDKNDSLFVGYCPVPSAWYGLSEEVSKWIVQNQPINS